MKDHFTAEQVQAWLIEPAGARDEAAAAHLLECGECRARVEELDQTLAQFRGAAMSWSAGQRGRAPAAAPAARWRQPAWVLAAALVVAAAVPAWHHYSRPTAAVTASATADLARDNQLLATIAADTGETVAAPLQPLQVNP